MVLCALAGFSALLRSAANLHNIIYYFNVRQKKCKFFHSFAVIKYVIFESVKKR
jgi:hypothetical protein